MAALPTATIPAFSTLPPPGLHGFHFPWEEASPELPRHSGISWIPSPRGFHGIFPGSHRTSGWGPFPPAEPWESSGRLSHGKTGNSLRGPPPGDPTGSGKGWMPTRRQGPSTCPVPVSPCHRVTAALAPPIPASPITPTPRKRDSGFFGKSGVVGAPWDELRVLKEPPSGKSGKHPQLGVFPSGRDLSPCP